jgi:hypothetical protein
MLDRIDQNSHRRKDTIGSPRTRSNSFSSTSDLLRLWYR